MKKNVMLIALWLSAISFGAPAADGSAQEPSPIWIDVRTVPEYESGHLPGARNINFDRVGAEIAAVTEDKQAPLVLYCQSGRRSGFAKQTLEALGYSNVTNAGGLRDALRATQLAPVAGPEQDSLPSPVSGALRASQNR